MLRCKECEFYATNRDGSPRLTCDPFSTIREPECLMKLQLVQLTTMARSHQATLEMYQRLAPLQEKMFRHMEREIDESEAADQWKLGFESEDEDENS